MSPRVQSRIRPSGGKRIVAIPMAADDLYQGIDVEVDSMTCYSSRSSLSTRAYHVAELSQVPRRRDAKRLICSYAIDCSWGALTVCLNVTPSTSSRKCALLHN